MDLDAMTTQELIAMRDRITAHLARRVLGDPLQGVSLGGKPKTLLEMVEERSRQPVK